MRLKSVFIVAVVFTTLCCGTVTHAQNKDKPTDAKKTVTAATNATGSGEKNAPAPDAQDEQAIRAGADVFAKLYNEHDAKKLAALFVQKAEIIDENEQVVKGRDAIEQAFGEVFKVNPKSTMKIEVESVRILAPQLAIEEGTTLSKDSPDQLEAASTYVAIHVKVDGKWLLACVRDWAASPAELTPHDHLLELGWLVGEWTQETGQSVVHTVCKWHDNDNFLVQEFKVQIDGKVAMSGTTRIGWDAVSKQFKSWVFDSHGGHAEGMWHRDGDTWIVKSRGSTAKGETASSTNVYRQIDGHTMSWRSFDRLVDGDPLDNIGEIVIKRRAPSPQQ